MGVLMCIKIIMHTVHMQHDRHWWVCTSASSEKLRNSFQCQDHNQIMTYLAYWTQNVKVFNYHGVLKVKLVFNLSIDYILRQWVPPVQWQKKFLQIFMYDLFLYCVGHIVVTIIMACNFESRMRLDFRTEPWPVLLVKTGTVCKRRIIQYTDDEQSIKMKTSQKSHDTSKHCVQAVIQTIKWYKFCPNYKHFHNWIICCITFPHPIPRHIHTFFFFTFLFQFHGLEL